MSSGPDVARRLVPALLLTAAAWGALPVPAAAQPDNVVTIKIVANQIKIGNRGVGVCKQDDGEDCKNQIVWQWQGGDVPEGEPKIVISFVKGTEGAFDCFKGAYGQPKLSYEIGERGGTATATVSADCPAKSAWLYQISCVRTDNGELCDGITPVDPGVVIG